MFIFNSQPTLIFLCIGGIFEKNEGQVCVSPAGKKSGWDPIRAVVVLEQGGLFIYNLLFVFILSSNLGCRYDAKKYFVENNSSSSGTGPVS